MKKKCGKICLYDLSFSIHFRSEFIGIAVSKYQLIRKFGQIDNYNFNVNNTMIDFHFQSVIVNDDT